MDERPVVCPFLDPAAQTCLVYDFRPIACRTYGFYVERGAGLFCRIIEQRLSEGAWPDVVWGNAESIQADAATLGDLRDLRELWYS